MKEKIKEIIKREKLTLIGAVVGAIAGFLYWYYIGCSSGSCPITSSPTGSLLYGMLLGALFFSIFKTKSKSENNS